MVYFFRSEPFPDFSSIPPNVFPPHLLVYLFRL